MCAYFVSGVANRGTDWTAARAYWLAQDPPRSYELVAQQFGISGTRVRFVAKRDNWQQPADEIDAAALERTKQRVLRTREQRNEIFLRIADKAFDRALEKLDVGELEVRLADLPALGKHAELILGEATDRVSFAELQEAIGVVLSMAIAEIPKQRQPVFLELVRERLGSISEKAA